MLKLTLTRFIGDSNITVGELKDEHGKLRLATYEKRCPEHWNGMKNFCALPCGVYKMSFMMIPNTLDETLKVSTTGTYRKAMITGDVLNVPAGSIVVGFSVENYRLRGRKDAIDLFVSWLRQKKHDGTLPWNPKAGDVILEIKNAPTFVYEETEEQEITDEEYDE